MLFPIEEINARISERDFEFFLGQKNFYKVVDTLEKYQEKAIDLDSRQGREFVVFKRQLFQMYEVQSRSISEHEAHSFEIDRENLKFLVEANKNFVNEISRLNDVEDLRAHANLKGALFRRKFLTAGRLGGLGYFGLAGLTYANFPLVASYLGHSWTMLGISGLTVAGMVNFREGSTINSIEIINDGEDQGKLKINVSGSLLSSQDIIADVENINAVFSLSNDDLGEDGVENNILEVKNFRYVGSNEVVQEAQFLLPAEAWRDKVMMDWVLRIKSDTKGATDELFNDLMTQRFIAKQQSGGITPLQQFFLTGPKAQESSSVDENIQAMITQFGEQSLRDMSPTEFYQTYQRVSQNSQ